MRLRFGWTWFDNPLWNPLAIVALALLGGAAGFWVGDRYGGPDGLLALTAMDASAGLAIGLGFRLKTGLFAAAVLGFGMAAYIVVSDSIVGLLSFGSPDGFPDETWGEALLFLIASGGYFAIAMAAGVLVASGLRLLNAAISRLRPRRRPA